MNKMKVGTCIVVSGFLFGGCNPAQVVTEKCQAHILKKYHVNVLPLLEEGRAKEMKAFVYNTAHVDVEHMQKDTVLQECLGHLRDFNNVQRIVQETTTNNETSEEQENNEQQEETVDYEEQHNPEEMPQ